MSSAATTTAASPSTNIIQSSDYVCLSFGILSRDETKIVIAKVEKSIGKMKGIRSLSLKTLVGKEWDHWYEYKAKSREWVQMDTFPYANEEHDEEKTPAVQTTSEEKKSSADDPNASDNRTIEDNNQAQKLSSDEIVKMRGETGSSSELIQKLIENSSTFEKKTVFSKDKYMKKKRQKYDLYAFVRRPSLDVIARFLFQKKAPKIGYLRWDTLAQLVYNAAIKPGANVMLLDTCHGLLSAALYDRYRESIRLYRLFPDANGVNSHIHAIKFLPSYEYSRFKPTEEEIAQRANSETRFSFPQDLKKNSLIHIPMGLISADMKKGEESRFQYYPPLVEEFNSAKIDCILLATDEFDIEEWFPKLYDKLMVGGNFSIYSRFQKPLERLFRKLRNISMAVEMYETWWRDYQVLKNRTHPKMLMNNRSGYVCHGVKIQEWTRDDNDAMEDDEKM